MISSDLPANKGEYKVAQTTSIYTVDKTRPKLAYNSGDQKLLAVKGSKRFIVLQMEKRRKHENSGPHEYRWKQLDFPNGSVYGKVQNGLNLSNCVAGTYIPYIHFYSYKLHLSKIASDMTSVNSLPVW
jgi:hypothetical protein